MDGLGSSLDVELQSGFFQLLLYRSNEGSYVAVAGGLGSVQLVLDVVIDVMFGIFQG